MHDALAMHVLHAGEDLAEEAQTRHRVRPLPAESVDAFAFHQLHDDEGRPVRRHAGIEDAADIGMAQTRENLLLARKPLSEDAVSGIRTQDLHRYRAASGPPAGVYTAHAARSQVADHGIISDQCRRGGGRRGRPLMHRTVQGAAAGGHSEEARHGLPQAAVAGGFTIQERAALRFGQLHGRLEENAPPGLE